MKTSDFILRVTQRFLGPKETTVRHRIKYQPPESLGVAGLALNASILLIAALTQAQTSVPAHQDEHGGHQRTSHAHRQIGLDLEINLTAHLDDGANDEDAYVELEVGVPSTHTWLGVGAGAVSGVGVYDHPNILGLLLGISLHFRPGPLELTARALYDQNFLPGSRLVRMEFRGLTTWRLGPVVRGVVSYAPRAWNQGWRVEATPLETTASAGVSWQVTRRFMACMLGGMAVDENPHAMVSLLLELHYN